MAICPAGPPKLMNPSFNQNQNACRKLTGWGRSSTLSTGSPVGVAVSWICVFMLCPPPRSWPGAHRRLRWRAPELVVVGNRCPQAGQDLLHPGGLRRLNATDVQEVNDGAEPVHALALQAEGGDQVFERHLCACMGKPCAIEVESQGAVWAFRWRSEPQDAGILINVAPNQPSASQSIHPRTCACRPGPPLIVVDKQPDDGAVNRMRFVRRARDWRPLPAQAKRRLLAPGLPGKKSMSLSWA